MISRPFPFLALLLAVAVGTCLGPQTGTSTGLSFPPDAVDVQTDTLRPLDDLLFTSIRYLPSMPPTGETWHPEVYAMDVDTGAYHRLTFDEQVMRHMAASPDRQKLALTRINVDTNGDGNLDELDDQALWVIDLPAGKAWSLTGPGASAGAGGLDWLDNETLIFNYRDSPADLYDLVRVDYLTGARTYLTNTPTIGETDVSASLDGSLIVYVAVDSEEVLDVDEFGPVLKGKVWMMNADGSGSRQLTDGGPLVGRVGLLSAGDYDPELSPDHTHVTFGRPVELGTNDLDPDDGIPGAGTHHVFSVDVNTLAVQELTQNTSVALIPDWDADGTIYFTEIAVTSEHQADPYLGIATTSLAGGLNRTEPFPPPDIWKGALVAKLIPPMDASSTDSDGDGCADSEEPLFGFDPADASDFFDVPVPASADPVPNGSKDRAVSIADVLAVLFYVGTFDGGGPNSNGVDYDSTKDGDRNGDTVVTEPGDQVGLDYDRSPSAAPNPPWGAGLPDGTISIQDVLVVVAQVGLDCSGPP